MTSFRKQLSLLLWKNFILRKRHKVRLVMEFLWPLFLFLILMWVRTKGLKEDKAACHLVEKTLPSVGGFEFLQNWICTLNNTCHADVVEDKSQELLAGALFPSFVRNTTGLLRNLVGSPEAVQSLRDLFVRFSNFLSIISGIRSNENLQRMGTVKLKELMTSEGRTGFMAAAPTYTSLAKDKLDEFLESDLHLDKLNRASFDKLMRDFTNGACNGSSKFELITVPSEALLEELCKMEREKAFFLIFLFSNSLNRTGISNSISRALEMERALINTTNPRQIDQGVVTNLAQLADQFNTLVNDLMAATAGRDGMAASAVVIYEGVCGMTLGANVSTFGLDTDTTNRMDSLRDRLRDFRTTNKYEPDPEVSAVCNMVFENLQSQPFTNLLWKQVKPFIRGKIFYAPDTSFTRAIMTMVDARFEELRELENIVHRIIDILHSVRLWLRNNNAQLTGAQQFFENGSNVNSTLTFIRTTFGLNDTELGQVRLAIERFRSVNLTQIDIILSQLDGNSEIQSEILNCIRYNKTQPFDTEFNAVEDGIKLLDNDMLWAVVIFEDLPADGSAPKHLKYKIRMDSDRVDGTRFARDRLTSKSPRRRPTIDLKYITNGFAYLQEMIEHSFIEVHNGSSVDRFLVYLQQFPFPCYIFDQFIRAISRTFPLFMVLSWVYASAMIIKSIVLEKELRLKEVMRVMGLSNGVIWCGWFIDSFAVMSVSTVVLSIILKYGKIIEFSDFLLILVFMMCFTVATICFSFLVSTCFARANSAAAAGGILFFVSYLPYNFMLMWEERLTWYHLLASSLISNVAFGFGCTYLARLEEDGIGAQWDRITLKTLPDDDFNLIYCILMLIFDSFLYMVLAWYIEAVFPGDTGTPKKWYFFVQKSYWVPGSVKMDKSYKSVPSEFPESIAITESEPVGLKCGVQVTNLSKTYNNGRVALTDLNISFFEGQITSFLGHNGAGKTTTISILTGLFTPTTGTAKIYGHDIRSEMDIIRKDLGICPQYNVLFDRLSVEEHMIFYAGLKGKTNIKGEINKMLEDLGIPEKKNEFPRNLSGGMKRKLSVAIAFVGGSKTVFLDEPTSGVDPYSRRSIWELLLKYKEGRTIILTTHFMDEADILGDRIAIISQGRLKACGSSLFLKSQFGQGYSLRLVRVEPSATETEDLILLNNMNPSENKENLTVQRALMHSRHTDLLRSFIQHRIPDATVIDDVGSEVIFLLPYTATSAFPTLFNEVDTNLENLRISSYGISDTTLEDVFLRITIEDFDNTTKGSNKICACCCLNMKLMSRVLRMKKRDKNRVADVPANSQQIVSKGNISRRSLTAFNQGTEIIQVDDQPPMRSRHSIGANIVDQTKDLEIISITGSKRSQEQLSREHSSTESHMNEEFPVHGISENATVFAPELNAEVDSAEIDTLLGSDTIHLTASESFVRKTSCWLVLLQYWVIILKRLLNSSRNMKAIFFEIILPATFICLTLAFTLILPTPMNEAPREITPWTYPSPNYIFFSESEPSTLEFRGVVDELTGPIGLGTPCLKNVDNGVCHPENWASSAVSAFNVSRFNYVAQPFGTCSCSFGSQQCEAVIEKAPPPSLKTPTDDFIIDASQLYLPVWLRDTFKQYDTKRYGGFEMKQRPPANTSITEFIDLLQSLVTLQPALPVPPQPENESHYKVWYENRGWVSSIAYLNGLHNMLLREKLAPELLDQKNEFGITLTTHPLNLTVMQQEKESLRTAALGVVHAICIIFALSFVPASFTVYLIEERKSGGKHLHLVSGVKPVTYWLSNFTFDMGKYCVTAFLCVGLFYCFDARAYISEESIYAFIILLVLYGWASIPLMYPASYLFGVPSTAFVVLACTNLFIGVITTVSTFVLEQLGDEELAEIGDVLQQVFLVFPHYCLGRGLIELVRLHVEATAFGQLLNRDLPPADRFEWKHLGKMLTCLIVQGFLFFAINLAGEYKQWVFWLCCKFQNKCHRGPSLEHIFDDDIDVSREADRVINHPSATAALGAENLTKIYSGKAHPAVNKLSFEIEKGECFGLLGVNGAGKTTTFKMLTGDVRITSGKAKVMGHDVEKSLDAARQHFGYCPQEDGLDPLLDGYEQLELYGRLRGMKKKDVQMAAKALIESFGLTRYVDKRCGTYSGGNKRKVSAAIALIGNPDVVFLDEPTSGMDPGARRQLWKVILKVIHLGKSVVLTTHSMEECEALCTRLAIMVNGKFMCLGSLQHLKNRFGSGYTLTVTSDPNKQEEFLKVLASDLPSAKLEGHHCAQLKFNILQQDVKLSDIFNVMFAAKSSDLVEDYSVSQTTLDDIFVKFASHQRDEMDKTPFKTTAL